MWGLIANLTVLPRRRNEMIDILRESAANMRGCLSYVVAKDSADENVIWVTEVWGSMAMRFVGANDGGSSAALLLGMARVLSSR